MDHSQQLRCVKHTKCESLSKPGESFIISCMCGRSPCWWVLRSHSSFIHVSLKSSRDFQNTLCACLIANARIKQDICISLCCVISLANFLLSSRIYDCLWHMKFCITFKPWLSVRVFLQKCLASSVHDVVAAHKVDQH